MKICVISAQVFAVPPVGYSGLEQLAWQMAKGLAQKGHKVAIVAPDGSTCPGVEVIHSGPPGIDERSAYKSYWHRLQEFDVIADSSWGKWAYILKMEGKLRAPVLGVTHAPVNTMMQSLPNVEKPCFVCISQDQADHFKGLFGREAKVCYNGVDETIYKPLDIPRSDRFLFLARFSRVKGALTSLQIVLECGTGLDLIGDTSITNEPEYFQQCLKLSKNRSPSWDKKEDQIRIMGGANRGECVWWFSQAKCLLHCNSEFREPFGLSPVESMLCGTPVIAFDNGAMRETIKEGVSGFLVRSKNEVIDIIKSGKINTIDRNSCREWAMNFSLDKMINRYESLCQEAIETGGW